MSFFPNRCLVLKEVGASRDDESPSLAPSSFRRDGERVFRLCQPDQPSPMAVHSFRTSAWNSPMRRWT